MREGEAIVVDEGASSQVVEEIRKQENTFHVGPVEFEALGDRLIVLEDPFVSGYECKTCVGKGWIQCLVCDDAGRSTINANIACKFCHGTKKLSCESCEGKGALLVIPEKSERRPTTGTIVSVGPGCKVVTRSMKVLYASFAGQLVELENKTVILRILHESELLCRVAGHLEMRRVAEE